MMRYTKALSMQNTSKPKIMNPTIQIKMQQIRMLGSIRSRNNYRIVTKQEAQARQVLNIPLAFICVTDNTLTNNIHHPKTPVASPNEQVQATPQQILMPITKV